MLYSIRNKKTGRNLELVMTTRHVMPNHPDITFDLVDANYEESYVFATSDKDYAESLARSARENYYMRRLIAVRNFDNMDLEVVSYVEKN